jgi:hypothetical protein
MELIWTEFKNFVVSRALPIQWIVVGDNYHMTALDGAMIVTCLIPTDPTNAETIDFSAALKAAGNKPQAIQNQPFASKTLPNGKKLYKREHGIQAAVAVGTTDVLFTIPYPWVKLIGIEILYGTTLDTCNLMILDSTTGTYTTIPNYKLNQFGFNVNVEPDSYSEESAYDADLYVGMQIKVEYTTTTAKTIAINFNINEVK